MKQTTIIVAIGLALAGALPAAPAQAQLQHTFVSSKGSDANNCSLATPCRHLQAALAATTPGGEIAILDSAGYNGGTTVTITQAVSIVAPLGIEAEIAPPSGGTGIVINTGASDAVSLRGLTIDGGGTGYNGIVFNTGQSLTVQNCVVRNLKTGGGLTGNGILFVPNTTSSLSVSNTLVADNGNSGIAIYPGGSASSTATFNRIRAINNSNSGILVDGANTSGTVKATVYDSVATGNKSAGFVATATSGVAQTVLSVFHSVAANNYIGVQALGTGAVAVLAQCMATGNSFGYDANSNEIIISYGDNYIPATAPLLDP